MVDLLILIVVVLFVFLGYKNKNNKITPYFISLLIGYFFAYVFNTKFSLFLSRTYNFDLAFSSVTGFAFLMIFGAIVLYTFLIVLFQYWGNQYIKLLNQLSLANIITLPLISLTLLITTGVLFIELQTSNINIQLIQNGLNSSKTVQIYKSIFKRVGFDTNLITNLNNAINSKQIIPDDVIPLDFKSTEIKYDQSIEVYMTELINKERNNNGLDSLIYDPKLAEVARRHSFDMLIKRYFAHINLYGASPFDRLKAENIKYGIAGENLAISTSIENAVNALMNSPKHKENILNNRFRNVGIGIGINQDGIMSISQEFTD